MVDDDSIREMAEAMLGRHRHFVYEEIEDRLSRVRDARDSAAILYWYFVRIAVDDLLQPAA